jgi:hypothetical protein
MIANYGYDDKTVKNAVMYYGKQKE